MQQKQVSDLTCVGRLSLVGTGPYCPLLRDSFIDFLRRSKGKRKDLHYVD